MISDGASPIVVGAYLGADASCPYCGNPRGYGVQSQLLKTCGSHECHHAAISAGIAATWAARDPREPLVQPPWWVRHDIDFRNGFASQNLTFAADRSRMPPR